LDSSDTGTEQLGETNMGDSVKAEATRKNLTFVLSRFENIASAVSFLLKILKTSPEVCKGWRYALLK